MSGQRRRQACSRTLYNTSSFCCLEECKSSKSGNNNCLVYFSVQSIYTHDKFCVLENELLILTRALTCTVFSVGSGLLHYSVLKTGSFVPRFSPLPSVFALCKMEKEGLVNLNNWKSTSSSTWNTTRKQ